MKRNNILEVTIPKKIKAAKVKTPYLIPETSKMYQSAYALFMNWKQDQKVKSLSEEVLLAYFEELTKKFKSSTLWTQYSMLKTTLNINDNIDISRYLKLKTLLKRHSDGYKPKKAMYFTSNHLDKFLREAPDETFLATKVALVIGITGACTRHELHQLEITNFTDLGSAVLVTIPDAKTRLIRNFTITGQYYETFKKYSSLRPQNANGLWFFVNYQKGKCTFQRMGVNKLGAMGKNIANYLKLPNPELYTGHCFRRSFTTRLVDTGKVHTQQSASKSKTGYIDKSTKTKLDIDKVKNN